MEAFATTAEDSAITTASVIVITAAVNTGLSSGFQSHCLPLYSHRACRGFFYIGFFRNMNPYRRWQQLFWKLIHEGQIDVHRITMNGYYSLLGGME